MQRRFFLTATASLLMAPGFLSSSVFAATRVMDTDLVIVGGAHCLQLQERPKYIESPVRRIERGSLQLMSGVGDTR